MSDLNFIANQVNANAMPANQQTLSVQKVTITSPGGDVAPLTVSATSNTTQGANILLSGNGSTTPNKSLRSFNGNFQIVNSAYSAVPLTLDDSGNLQVTGAISAGGTVTGSNLTASSDERLKKDWTPLAGDLIEQLARLKSGTYTRVDTGERHVGVGAQSLSKLLPEAVAENEDGMLAVAYGHAALAICVELAKEIVRLRALLEPVK
ncbi:tail fiber domain-containing protein [Burkholderia ubonensis]|uniref:tail fiber domain-containing protein n=1 Tax=Burkholderia ubonensis TaxID=101571 RepID=UPI0012FC591E|nr:tail fiber domain-containing protein [Burkholderia ubonensis]